MVYPEKDMGIRLANRLETARALDFVQLSEKINVSKMQVPGKLIGRAVVELKLRSEFGLNIQGARRGCTSSVSGQDEIL